MEEAVFNLELEDDLSILFVKGKLFTAQTEKFNKQLKSALENSSKIIIDLSELEYICSAGVGAIVACYKKSQIEGGNVIISGANIHIQKIFEIIGFSKIFAMTHSWADKIEDAKKTLNQM